MPQLESATIATTCYDSYGVATKLTVAKLTFFEYG